MFPIVESGAFYFTVIEGEAEWLNEMQCCAGGEAGTSDVPCVPMNFGVDEDDVNGQRKYSDVKAPDSSLVARVGVRVTCIRTPARSSVD